MKPDRDVRIIDAMIVLALITGALAMLFLASKLFAAWPPSGRIRLLWDFRTNELSTNLTFKIYHATNLDLPLTNWALLTNVVGTNTSVALQVEPGFHAFYVTASNFWGESPPSGVASTPPLPRSDAGLSVQREP